MISSLDYEGYLTNLPALTLSYSAKKERKKGFALLKNLINTLPAPGTLPTSFRDN